MPNLETLHGNEELIEQSSDMFYVALDPHTCPNTGHINEEAARETVAEVWAELMLDENGRAVTNPNHLRDIESGYDSAIETLNDRKRLLDWM